ncbi:MAG: hypothetical protein CL608_09425 [Anaerolineaceae bacterium]|nr:hypothetical protein [Anaerolineaceae bacterium]
MNANFHRARLLMEHRRYNEAIEPLQAAIAENPEFGPAHALIAICHTKLEHHAAALQAAQTAVRLDPNSDFHLYTLAVVQLEQEKYDDAERSIRSAIMLEPTEPDYYGLLSSIFVERGEWNKALEAANEGLRLDPEHVRCANLRAMALVKMGDRTAASQTIDTALSQNPDNPLTHANKGWTNLHQSKPREAMHHFGEALRLDPNLQWAQVGIVEAMKARNPIYRVMLAYFLWMERLDNRTRWFVILGAYFLFRFLNQMRQANSELQPVIMPLLYVYMTFVFLTWTSRTLFDLFLRLDRFGRLALSRERLIISNWIGLTLLLALGFLVTGLLGPGTLQDVWLMGALETAVFIIPLATALRMKKSKLLLGFTAVLGGLILYNLLFGLIRNGSGTGLLYWFGIVLFSWVANIEATRRRR